MTDKININPVDYAKIAYIMANSPCYSELEICVRFSKGLKRIRINLNSPYYTIGEDDEMHIFNYNHNTANELRKVLENKIEYSPIGGKYIINSITCKCIFPHKIHYLVDDD